MDDIVSNPIAANNRGELICMGDIPGNAVLSILKGKAGSLIVVV